MPKTARARGSRKELRLRRRRKKTETPFQRMGPPSPSPPLSLRREEKSCQECKKTPSNKKGGLLRSQTRFGASSFFPQMQSVPSETCEEKRGRSGNRALVFPLLLSLLPPFGSHSPSPPPPFPPLSRGRRSAAQFPGVPMTRTGRKIKRIKKRIFPRSRWDFVKNAVTFWNTSNTGEGAKEVFSFSPTRKNAAARWEGSKYQRMGKQQPSNFSLLASVFLALRHVHCCK